MKFKKIIFILSFLIIESFATNEAVIEVIQPNMHENGIAKTSSTYVRSIGHSGSSYLSFTFAANKIDTYAGVHNRNLANLYKLSINILNDPYSRRKIEAELVLPEDIIELEQKFEYSMERILKETIDCLVQNAGVFYSDLDLKITGDSKYSKFEKVYSTDTGETRKRNKFFSIQIKSFPIEELKEAISFFNSYREIGLLTYMEKAIVKNKEFLRIKIGCFDNMPDAELAGYLLKKIKGVDFFITNFSGTVSNYAGYYKIINTQSGIWIKNIFNEKEMYNFVNVSNIKLEKKAISISNKILKFNLDDQEVKINLQEMTRGF